MSLQRGMDCRESRQRLCKTVQVSAPLEAQWRGMVQSCAQHALPRLPNHHQQHQHQQHLCRGRGHTVMRAGGFAHAVTLFCERLGWLDMQALLSCFAARISHGVRTELVALTEIPYVKGARARLLYRAGLRTPEAVAAADQSRCVVYSEWSSRPGITLLLLLLYHYHFGIPSFTAAAARPPLLSCPVSWRRCSRGRLRLVLTRTHFMQKRPPLPETFVR